MGCLQVVPQEGWWKELVLWERPWDPETLEAEKPPTTGKESSRDSSGQGRR